MSRLRSAVNNGNWSDPNTWNDGLSIQNGDSVVLNTYDVTLNVDNVNLENLTSRSISFDNNDDYSLFNYMTTNTTPEGTVENSYGFTNAFFHFTKSTYTDIYFNGQPYWVSYEFDNQQLKTLGYYKFSVYNNNDNRNPRNWEFQAWDGSQWVVLDSQVNYTAYTNNEYVGDLSSNNTAYYKYRMYVTSSNESRFMFRNMLFYEKGTYAGNVSIGGSLIINDSKTITVENTVYAEGWDFIECNTTASDTINLNATVAPFWYGGNNQYATVVFNGDGTLNLNRGIETAYGYYIQRGSGVKAFGDNCTINITGNVGGGGGNPSYGIITYGSNTTLNIVGDCEAGGGIGSVGAYLYGGGTLNITGDLYAWNTIYSGRGYHGASVQGLNAIVNVVGNIYGTDLVGTSPYQQNNGLYIGSASEVSITGNITGGRSTSEGYKNSGVYISTAPYVSFDSIGTLTSGSQWPAIWQRELSSNMFNPKSLTGPFISNEDGVSPFYMASFKITPTYNNYIRFYSDENPSQAYDLLSADTIIDSPAEEDVRQGTTYANGSYTGTLAVPLPGQVALGIATDDTTGTAALNASDVWSEQVSTMTTAGSIGERLKNASTVESTGDQLESFL